MLFDGKNFDFRKIEKFDLVVVGAGAVGLCLAVKLARGGTKVVLLEAGPSGPDDNSQSHFRNATASGLELPGLHIGRFRCLGGTTNFWGGQLVPFSRTVFAERPWVSEAAWPIRFDDIAPYYDEAFDLLGLKHVINRDEDVWRDLGVDPPKSSKYIEPILTRWTPECNLKSHFKEEIHRSPNLSIFLNAQVGAIETDGASRVTGLQIRFTDREPVLLPAPLVVLANGTIEIVRLLQISSANDSAVPWANNQWVGHGFFDHVDCYAGVVEPVDWKRFANLFDNAFVRGLKYSPKLKLSEEIQMEEHLPDMSSHFIFNSSAADHIANLKILVKGLTKGRLDKRALTEPMALLKSLRFVIPMAMRYMRYRRMSNLSDGGIQLRLTCEQTPLRESRIKLRKEKDAFGMPIVDVEWRVAEKELNSYSKFAVMIKEYLEQSKLANTRLDPRLLNAEPSFLNETDDANHQMGGARMAVTSQTGVVDSSCRVFGTENLYVAGAAVYPSSGFANPTVSAIALGLRLADHIMDRTAGKDVACSA